MVAHKRTEAGRVRSVFRSDPAAEKQIGRENDRCVLACLGVTHLPFFTQFTQPSARVYTGLGMPAMLPIMIISFIQTGFFEEFLFRGFISKRLVRQFGDFGILLQAILFGSLHVLLAGNLTLLSGTIIFTTTTAGGFLLGYLAEKSFQGSILPGAFMHGLGNFIINLIQAFS